MRHSSLRASLTLAPVLAFGLTACDRTEAATSKTAPASEPAQRTLTEADDPEASASKNEKGTGGGTAPVKVQVPDLEKICAKQVEFVAEIQAKREGGPRPPQGWQEGYESGCVKGLEGEIKSLGSVPFMAYERCLAKAKTPDDWGSCQQHLESDKETAKLASQTRAPLPKDVDACKPRLPVARKGVAPATGVDVRVSKKAICIGDRPVVAMVGGKVDPGAVEHHGIEILEVELKRLLAGTLAEDDAEARVFRSKDDGLPSHSARLSVDVDVDMTTLLSILATLQRANVTEYWLAMETAGGGGTSHHLLHGPRFMDLDQDPAAAVSVVAFDDEFRVMADSATPLGAIPKPAVLKKVGGRELPALPELQAALREALGETDGLVTVKIRGDADQPYRAIAAIVAAAPGADCPVDQPRSAWTADRCLASRIELDG